MKNDIPYKRYQNKAEVARIIICTTDFRTKKTAITWCAKWFAHIKLHMKSKQARRQKSYWIYMEPETDRTDTSKILFWDYDIVDIS
jgi:hypothetical protein